jgi:hypothetical protein
MKENTEPDELPAISSPTEQEAPSPALSEEDESVILKRLKELGYVE